MASVGGNDLRSGPRVAKLFQQLLSLVFLNAWLSLSSQIDVLIGHRGLLPIEPLVEHLSQREIGFSQFPSLLLFGASDSAVHTLLLWGTVLSLASLIGVYPRLLFAINTALYLSAAVACQSFLTFQWDNLLLECGLLATFLSVRSEQRWAHFLLRVLLFKLYFESGIAKYQSHLGDWQDGSAMSFYYETAPIPTAFAWFMHHMPAAWHKLESWLTLIWEIGVPFAIFGPRPARRVAFAVFSTFQLINLFTANYGFFCVLALVLQVFLLDERDLSRLRAALRKLRRRALRRQPRLQALLRRTAAVYRLVLRRLNRLPQLAAGLIVPRAHAAISYVAAGTLTSAYLALSLHTGLSVFWRNALPDDGFLQSIAGMHAPFRLVNAYHLFGHITRARIEPELQVMTDAGFQPLAMHYKPGPLDRAPPFVAPHQPRVDFLLWFYGLSHQRGTPQYVKTLLHRLCEDPRAVQSLFVTALPQRAQAVRIEFHAYHFTTPVERDVTGNWWTRETASPPITLPCAQRQ